MPKLPKKKQGGENKKQPTKTSPTQNPRDVILGGGNNDQNTYPGSYPSGSREAQINQINREYDAKIRSIRNNPYLSQAEKDRAIRQLENDRRRKINAISGSYAKNKNGKAYKKGNKGKHLGWEKGKGNPHKNGGKPGKKG